MVVDNTITKATQWKRPSEAVHLSEIDSSNDNVWSRHVDANGREYFFNPHSGTTAWELPPDAELTVGVT
jgi:hypothetical protein